MSQWSHPAEPRHIVAQQLLALCLQNHRIGSKLWVSEWNGLPPFDRSAEPILRYLTVNGFIDLDGELLFIGPEAEAKFGRRHFMGMTAAFTAPPQFTVLSGRDEIGRTDPTLLTERIDGPRLLLLGGRSWRVTWIDWRRQRCFVEPAERGGRSCPPHGRRGHGLRPGINCLAEQELTRGATGTESALQTNPVTPIRLNRRFYRHLQKCPDLRL